MRYDLRAVATALPLVLAAPGIAIGQPVPSPTVAEAQAALTPAPVAYTRAQLDQMLAPVALYPDQLLLELLMASTFPQQLIDAQQWLQDPSNAALKGDALVAALQPLPWDPSVKSLAAFPQIIAMMNAHLDWTEALGTAFANQQVAVMARVQFLRERAARAGRLASTKRLVVHHSEGEIVIEPADPDMIYVPVYNPAEVYGEWPDRDEPPVYIPPPPGLYAGALGAGIGFSVGFGVARPLWGWGHPDWRRHEVVVDPHRYEQITNATSITNNNIAIHNDTWHRTAPVTPVPPAQRPQPPAAVVNAPRPPGTVASTAVVVPKPAPTPGAPAHPATPTAPAAAVHPPAAPPPPAAPTAPAAVVHPPAAPPHPAAPPAPAAVVHPPAAPPHPAAPTAPAAVVHPPAAPPHPAAPPAPAAVVHPPAAPPHPAAPPAPAAVVHPPAAPPHPAAPAAPAAVVHPPAAPPHPAAPTAPAAVVHPPAAPPHPTAPPAPAAVVHPPAAPPHPAAAPAAAPHPAEPAKKPPQKPGENEKEQH